MPLHPACSPLNRTSLFFVAALLVVPAFAAQIVLPTPLPPSRYERMIERSPFGLDIIPTVLVEKGPGPFANLFVSAIAQLTDADGKVQNVVTIKSRADQSTFTLVGNEAGKDGIHVAGIEWSDLRCDPARSPRWLIKPFTTRVA